MIYAVKANIELKTSVNRNDLVTGIKNKIAGKLLWTDQNNPTQLNKGESENGNPAVNVAVKFTTEKEQLEVANYIRDRIAQIPALSGRVQIHLCGHDEGKRCEQEIEI